MDVRTAIDATQRNRLLSDLEGERFDVLIIGAGITGCGIAREAAMRGLSTLLVDAGDIASGTSGRSSKLIHGGLRYLAQGQMTVVREAARERRTLRKIAPHLSLTNPMVVLARSGKAVRILKTGMWTYEKLGEVDPAERHVQWDRELIHLNEPFVDSKDLEGALVYPEYLTDDARLTLANARSAAAHGAKVATYTAVVELLKENGKVTGAVLTDVATEAVSAIRVHARQVINAAGPWVDIVRKFEDRKARNKLQLTKGIHIVVSRSRLPLNNTVVWTAGDGRGLFAVPRGGFVYIGTTDTFFPKPAYWPEITREDIIYLTASADTVFDMDPIRDTDILALWSGIRPLLGARGKKPSEISRRNEIFRGPGGMLTVAGGKLTSFRSMAQRVADQCEKLLNRKPGISTTGEIPLPGGDFAGTFAALTEKVRLLGFSEEEAGRLAGLYGNEALEIFSGESGPAGEAAFAVRFEGALMLEDYWIRRSARSYFDVNNGIPALESASKAMARLLGWSESKRMAQVDACVQKQRNIITRPHDTQP